MARIHAASDESISFLSKCLLGGEIVAVPTETVYGLAANAYDATACARIFEAKQRPSFDPLIVHLPLGFDLRKVADPNPSATALTKAFWPGPLTLVLPKKSSIPGIVTSGLDSIAVRTSRHPVFQRLLAACQLPLAAPSANPFGYVSPTTARHVMDSLGTRVPHILDGGPCEIGLESTIVDVRNPFKPILLRPGSICREDISRVLNIEIGLPPAGKHETIMPGQLLKHYSPRSSCRLRAHIDPAEAVGSPETAFLFYAKPFLSEPVPPNIFWLSEEGGEIEAARRLFDLLRRIDERGFGTLWAETAPESGLGYAINDRLRRAAAEDEGSGPAR